MWVVPVRLNEGMILIREGEIGNQVSVRDIIGKTGKSFPLFGGQKGPRHSVSHRLSKRVSVGRCMEAMEIKAFFMAQ